MICIIFYELKIVWIKINFCWALVCKSIKFEYKKIEKKCLEGLIYILEYIERDK